MKQRDTLKGFTLIETLVSLAIFSMVIVTVTGVILSIITATKRNQAISGVVNNLNYAVDSMVRDISTGYRYRCGFDQESYLLADMKTSPSTCSTISDKHVVTLISTITGTEQVVKYKFVPAVNGSRGGYIEKTVYKEDGLNSIPINYPLTDSQNIDISELQFTVTNPPNLISDAIPGQPSVFLVIKGTAKINQINISDFFIQTFISQRLPNFI